MSESQPVDPGAYNYAVFPPDSDRGDFARFVDFLPVGKPAPDCELVSLDDRGRVRLSDYWQNGPCVLEFGSIT